MDIESLLRETLPRQASDLHLKTGRPPLMRINGELWPLEYEPVTGEVMESWIRFMAKPAAWKKFEDLGESDFAYSVEGVGRFRVNAFRRLGEAGIVARRIPFEIPTLESFGLPEVFCDLVTRRQGLVLVTGPTGSGKSTTLAAMIDRINRTRRTHVVTIEDPVEFVYTDYLSTINQREVGQDTAGFKEALKRALRQDPDVILVGEMRDVETMEIAMQASETGHLVLSTLHTNDCKQTIDRILDAFPPEAAGQIRAMLAMTLLAVVSQRLVRRMDGRGRVAAIELMINSPHMKQLLAEGKTGDIDKAMFRSASHYNMQTFNQALAKLVNTDVISTEEALSNTSNPEELTLILKGIQTASTSDSSDRTAGMEWAQSPDHKVGPDNEKSKIQKGFDFYQKR